MTPKSFKKLFGELPKTQFKTAMENTENLMKKGVQNEVSKRGRFDDFRYFFEVWVQRCPRVVPGTFPGFPQGQKSSKMGVKMTPKSSTNVVRRLSENASQRHTH